MPDTKTTVAPVAPVAPFSVYVGIGQMWGKRLIAICWEKDIFTGLLGLQSVANFGMYCMVRSETEVCIVLHNT